MDIFVLLLVVIVLKRLDYIKMFKKMRNIGQVNTTQNFDIEIVRPKLANVVI